MFRAVRRRCFSEEKRVNTRLFRFESIAVYIQQLRRCKPDDRGPLSKSEHYCNERHNRGIYIPNNTQYYYMRDGRGIFVTRNAPSKRV